MEISYQEKSSAFANSKKYREQLLSGLPVEEKTHEIAGILTTFLEGGDGPPVILLHGPGESSFWCRLVLVDSLGLGRFRPAPGFALKLLLYIIRPNEKTYQRFLPECIYDVESLRIQMGEY